MSDTCKIFVFDSFPIQGRPTGQTVGLSKCYTKASGAVSVIKRGQTFAKGTHF